jgi:hypothetical protein
MLHNLVELFELVTDDLCSHRISNSISVNKDMIWKCTIVMFFESLESTFKVLLKHTRADDFLPLLTLWTCLCVVFAHVLIISCAKADDTLLALVANIDTNQHGLI